MIHIYYGKGKGKTSSALGLIMRACGSKKKIVLFRFLKPKNMPSGEDIFLSKLSNLKEFRFNYPHPIFIKGFNKKGGKVLENQINNSLNTLKAVIKQGRFDILVLDEILNLINLGTVNEADIIKLIKKLRNKKEVILTGRKASNKLKRIADYITELKLIKHPFQKGISARKGIEY